MAVSCFQRRRRRMGEEKHSFASDSQNHVHIAEPAREGAIPLRKRSARAFEPLQESEAFESLLQELGLSLEPLQESELACEQEPLSLPSESDGSSALPVIMGAGAVA